MDFYTKNGFKLFPCKLDKSPNLSRPGLGWRDSEAHLTTIEAQDLAEKGNLIGAWIPENMIVIDVDRNHYDKLGNEKPDGLEAFTRLCEEKGLANQLDCTFTVQTGSGGYHLYYTVPETLSQRQLTTSVDTRTHNGYVIAQGCEGYTIHTDMEPVALPQQFMDILRTKAPEKADKMEVKRPLSAKLLKSLLKKLPATSFNNNEEWLEFMMSTIATTGNSEEIITILTHWSREDPAYENDQSIRTRIESLSPNGNITPATFLYILKKEGISPYFIQQVRKQIGAEFQVKTQSFITHYDLPIALNMGQFEDRLVLAKSFFYTLDQASATRLIEYLVKDKIVYERASKEFYYFNGSRWILLSEIAVLVYNILIIVADECFIRFAKDDADGAEILNECVHAVSQVHWRQQVVQVLRQSDMIGRRNFPWDSPETAETLTFTDGVVDFSDGGIKLRQGRPEEYRRSFIDLPAQEVIDAEEPTEFRAFLSNVFPNEDTRKTALQALSLAVSGTGKYRKFQIWNGAGKNGKSLLMEIMQKIIGERAITYNTNILLQRKGADDAHAVTPGMARFQGALFACGSETEEQRKISQGLVKNLTGNETITANPKYKDEISFKTTFQVVLATNYLPAFSAYDEAFIDRLLVIPFYTSFYSDEGQKGEFENRHRKYILPAENPAQLTSRVVAERPGIIKKLIRVYLDLEPEIYISPECKEMLALYVEDNNDLGRFIDTYCTFGNMKDFAGTKDLVDFFNDENNSRYSSQWMGKRLKQLYPEIRAGRKSVNGSVQRGFFGVKFDSHGVDFEGMEEF